jgi:hypothetical protein
MIWRWKEKDFVQNDSKVSTNLNMEKWLYFETHSMTETRLGVQHKRITYKLSLY